MSLIYMQKFENCIKVISDGCAWDEDGNVAWLGSKIRLAHGGKPLVMAGVGDQNAVMVFASVFERLTEDLPLDRAIDLVEHELSAAPAMAQRIYGRCGFMRIFLAGWTVERGFFLAVGEFDPSKPDQVSKWRIDTTGQLMNIASRDPSVFKLRDNPMNVTEETFDGFVMPFVDWNRNQLATPAGGGVAHHACGGKIEVATITADGVSVDVVHDYGDVIGRPIMMEAA
ncbi:hypothetical protein O9X80_06305 [Agrobacterium salinitolerans]|uniref:hypothetical protein n=1 Tax=Agrobacterium salinitolerans TaxID=1183413 RepID=UPI0022B825E3|nr:hypothetical protein [Agrobacterium salinitolerans]MCZ7974104.1 hypothetical protein [Agrobacterium salinitolerans]